MGSASRWHEPLSVAQHSLLVLQIREMEEVLTPREALRELLHDASEGLLGWDAILINTSRGPLIDEGALVAAVRAGKIIAALDVYDKEPLPQGHPLRASGNTVLTPHLGYGVEETWRDFYPRSIENALAFLDGAPIRVLGVS